LATQGDSRYHPPSEYCGSTEEIEVTINEPANESQVSGNEVKVAGKIVSLNDIEKIEILINGEVKETLLNTKKFEKIFSSLSDGVYVIRVKAKDIKGNQSEREIKIGVNVPSNWTPSPTPTPTFFPTPSPSG